MVGYLNNRYKSASDASPAKSGSAQDKLSGGEKGAVSEKAPDATFALSGKKVVFANRVDEVVAEAMKSLPGKTSAHVQRALLDYLRSFL